MFLSTAVAAFALALLTACGGSTDDLSATSDGSETSAPAETSSDSEIDAPTETSTGSETGDESDEVSVSDEGEPIPIDLDALAARTWALRFGGGPDGDVPIVDGSPITITFRDGRFSGTSACNGYGGTYTIDGSRLTLGEISQDAMACGDDVSASEDAFMSALNDVDGINLLGDELALSGMATELIFFPAEAG